MPLKNHEFNFQLKQFLHKATPKKYILKSPRTYLVPSEVGVILSKSAISHTRDDRRLNGMVQCTVNPNYPYDIILAESYTKYYPYNFPQSTGFDPVPAEIEYPFLLAQDIAVS